MDKSNIILIFVSNKTIIMTTWEKNTKNFAYRFIEDEDGLTVQVWHRHGEMIKEEIVEF